MTELSVKPLRVLIVDDSAYNRRALSEMMESTPDVEVAGTAADGEEALRLVNLIKPDVVTLDLEMPRMDGFTFLRILMSKRPTPVIVVSSYSQKENVFKALELGALDFVAKPERYIDLGIEALRKELIAKIQLARSLRAAALMASREVAEQFGAAAGATPAPNERRNQLVVPRRMIAIASSTGGPSALMSILSHVPQRSRHAIVIAQHMPHKFTRTFSERLHRRSTLQVSEAQDGDLVGEGMAFVCPGDHSMEVQAGQNAVRLAVRPPDPQDRYIPSADRLLISVARAFGSRAFGLILTGMGDDGVEGARAIIAAGGVVIAEHESTAVVNGMPSAAERAGAVTQRLPLHEIPEWLQSLTT